MRIIFMGSPPFALPSFAALRASRHEICAVYSQPPRPAGRGLKLQPTAVAAAAVDAGLPVLTPLSLKSPQAQREFADFGADCAVVVAYGLLLPRPILEAPRFGAINLHPSDLPRWRGAAPIQRTLMAGDTQTAICVIALEEGLDSGPILARQPYSIPPHMDAGKLQEVAATRGATLLCEVLDALEQGRAHAVAQASSGVTYAEKIRKLERAIDWRWPAARILAHIRGLSPAPAATAQIDGQDVKIFRAQIVAGLPGAAPGTVATAPLRIQCGDGCAMQILELQYPGKTRQRIL